MFWVFLPYLSYATSLLPCVSALARFLWPSSSYRFSSALPLYFPKPILPLPVFPVVSTTLFPLCIPLETWEDFTLTSSTF